MAVSLVGLFLLPCSLVHLQTFRLEPSGKNIESGEKKKSMFQPLIKRSLESTAPRSLLHNPEPGTLPTGEWIGISCKEDTDGKTRSWAGNHPRMACRALALPSGQRKRPSDLPRSRDTSILSRSRMSVGSFPRLTPTTLSIRQGSSSTSRPNNRVISTVLCT